MLGLGSLPKIAKHPNSSLQQDVVNIAPTHQSIQKIYEILYMLLAADCCM